MVRLISTNKGQRKSIMVNKRKIRLTEKELEQFIGGIVDSVMINEQADHSKFASQLYNAMDGLGTILLHHHDAGIGELTVGLNRGLVDHWSIAARAAIG